MDPMGDVLQHLEIYGIGRRKLDDPIFADDAPPKRLGIYDVDDERLCHDEIQSICQIPGCPFVASSLLEYENHYNASHRYSCSQCKKLLPSPHLLDLHIQETHDSFFAVMSAKKPSYCCYLENCKDKFMNTEERLEHCVAVHKLPKDFRFDQRPKAPKNKKLKEKADKTNSTMEVDEQKQEKQFKFSNSKHKAFVKYTGKKFTSDKDASRASTSDVNMDALKESLPQD